MHKVEYPTPLLSVKGLACTCSHQLHTKKNFLSSRCEVAAVGFNACLGWRGRLSPLLYSFKATESCPCRAGRSACCWLLGRVYKQKHVNLQTNPGSSHMGGDRADTSVDTNLKERYVAVSAPHRVRVMSVRKLSKTTEFLFLKNLCIPASTPSTLSSMAASTP